jgi:putative sigma-54 modulation protein
MRVDVTGRHVEITPPLRLLITERLAKLERVLNDNALSAHVILTKEKYRHRTEMVIHARGDHMMRGLGEGNAWPASVRQAAEKIEQQAQTLKGKWAERKSRSSRRRPVADGSGEESGQPRARIVRARKYPVKPMTIEDAALRVDQEADTFLVFRNAETEGISILYRRKDGNLGLIEPD